MPAPLLAADISRMRTRCKCGAISSCSRWTLAADSGARNNLFLRVGLGVAFDMSVRISLVLVLAALAAGCQHEPPRESGRFREAELVEIVTMDPSIRLDIRYATTNNFLHRPVYLQARAFLQRPAAEALLRAHRALHDKGFGLVLFDGYRPWSVTKVFWDSASAAERKIEFVANPRKGSRHNRGCAVDLSLVDLRTGLEATMPSGYDEFTERAFPTYAGGTAETRIRRDLLRAAMEAEGFTVYPAEWWHFDYKDWRQYHIMDMPFEAIGK
jgi:D-alanyl-D-alanine dipeptidase